MPQLPLLSGTKIVKILSKVSYRAVREHGSHIRLQHSERDPVTVPDYRQIDRSLLRKILHDANLSPAEFIKLLKNK